MLYIKLSPLYELSYWYIFPFPFVLQQQQQQKIQIEAIMRIIEPRTINKIITKDEVEKGLKVTVIVFPLNPVYITKYHFLSSYLGILYS